MSCHAAHTRETTSARPAPPTETNKGSRERNRKECPHPRTSQVCYTPRRRNERRANDARRRPTYPHPSSCLTGRNERESRRRERQRHSAGGKVRAREEGEQRKGKRATKPRTKQEVASSRARDAHREGGTAGTRHTAGTTPHRSTESGAPGEQEKSGTAHHSTHRTDTTNTAHTQTCAHSTWPATPGSPPRGRAVGGGGAPDPRRPSQRRTARPPGTPYRHPHGAQRRPAGARALGPVLGPHARTDRTPDTRVAEPWLPAPEDGRPGEGQRLTPDAPHNGGRPASPGRAPHQPAARSPHRACRPREQCWAPTPTHPRSQHVGGGPQQPAQWAGSRGRDSA